MSTSCQFVIDRAKDHSQLNRPLASDPAEMMSTIRGIQQRASTATAALTRDRFKKKVTVTSANGSSERILDLADTLFDPPIERILKVTLPTGVEISQVDELDVEAELAPRYFVRGTHLVEVSNDWSASAGAIALDVLYVYGATPIVPTANPAQTNVSIPDEHVDILIKPLAMYLHLKDPGRDPMEYDRLEKEYEQAWEAYVTFLTNYSGNESRRFALPAPPEIGKR